MKDCLYIDNHILVVGKDHNISLSDLKERVKEDLKKENQKNSFVEQINPLSSLNSILASTDSTQFHPLCMPPIAFLHTFGG